jgi:predicted ATPase
MGTSFLFAGDFTESRAHYDNAFALSESLARLAPAHGADHPQRARQGDGAGGMVQLGGVDSRVVGLSYRAIALWSLGYPTAALADINHAIKIARDSGQATTLLAALTHATVIFCYCGSDAEASAGADEAVALAEEKGIPFWRIFGEMMHGCVLARFNMVSDNVRVLSSAVTSLRSTGTTMWETYYLSYLAKAHAQLGKFDDAWRCIGEATTAIETVKNKLCEAEVHRVAGEIALMSPQPDAAKAEACFERALAVARAQQARSWELRAAVSMSRLWLGQGKRQQAHDLLAPVYSWFTEGFDTLDLKDAKTLLAELVDNT